MKQDTYSDIIQSEHDMALQAVERYGDFAAHALDASLFLGSFLKTIDPDRFIFAAFLSQIRKHHTLAILSTFRLHHVQAMMDLRQVIEAVSFAAFALEHPGEEHFVVTDENGVIDTPQKLDGKRYDWVQKNFEKISEKLKGGKETINSSSGHPNLISAFLNFQLNPDKPAFMIGFFDFENNFRVKSDLWYIGNLVIGLTDLFYAANKERSVIKFADDFIPRLKELESENIRLNTEMKNTEEYKRVKQFAA